MSGYKTKITHKAKDDVMGKYMMHYAMFKLKEGILLSDALPIMEKGYMEIEKEINVINTAHVLHNCYTRDTNCDIMIVLNIEGGVEALSHYLEHPLHLNLKAKTKHLIELACSFDSNNFFETI